MTTEFDRALTQAAREQRRLEKTLTETQAMLVPAINALRRLTERVEQIELPDGSTPDTCEARAVLARFDGDV